MWLFVFFSNRLYFISWGASLPTIQMLLLTSIIPYFYIVLIPGKMQWKAHQEWAYVYALMYTCNIPHRLEPFPVFWLLRKYVSFQHLITNKGSFLFSLYCYLFLTSSMVIKNLRSWFLKEKKLMNNMRSRGADPRVGSLMTWPFDIQRPFRINLKIFLLCCHC